MNRRTLFFTGLTGLAGCYRGSQPRLNVYNWSNYIGPHTLEQFQKHTGIRIRYGIFESSAERVLQLFGVAVNFVIVNQPLLVELTKHC